MPVTQVLPQQTWPVPQSVLAMQATQMPFWQTLPPMVLQVVPFATAQHVPSWPLTLHAWQSSQPAIVQQTPFTQLPVWHCVPPVHGEPEVSLPHTPLMQEKPEAQSLLEEQLVRQAVPALLQA